METIIHECADKQVLGSLEGYVLPVTKETEVAYKILEQAVARILQDETIPSD